MTMTLHRRGALGPLLSGLWLCAALGAAAAAEPSPGDPVETEAVALLSQYLMLDTTNPPGNELIAARFLQALFDHEGIETRVMNQFRAGATCMRACRAGARDPRLCC